MFIIDTAGPISGERVFQRLGLADAFIGAARDLVYQPVGTAQDFFIGLLPIKVILPGIIGKDQFQSRRSLSTPFSSSSWTMDSIKRLVFFGDRNR
jgi:hypothetical protein